MFLTSRLRINHEASAVRVRKLDQRHRMFFGAVSLCTVRRVKLQNPLRDFVGPGEDSVDKALVM